MTDHNTPFPDERDTMISDLVDAVIWMSGSEDFAPDTPSGDHFRAEVIPALERAMTHLGEYRGQHE